MSPERFDLDPCDGESGECRAKLVKQYNGEWVAYSDYETLEDKCQELQKKIDAARESLS